MSKTEEGSATDADIQPLPWEKRGSENTVEEDLIGLLDSEFDDEEDSKDDDELESDDDDLEEDEDEEDDETGDDDPEEDEDDGSEEDEDDKDEEEEDEDSDDDSLYEVTVQGKVEEVTLEELQAGYSRTADYTRKRQADVAEHATEMEGVRVVRQQYDEHLEKLQAVMESMTPADAPDEELRKKDPGEYAAQKQDYADRVLAIQRVADERVKVKAEKDKEDNAVQAVYLQGEMDKLKSSIKGWDNDATRATEIAKLREFAIETYKFTAEELDNVVDHRLLVLLNENLQSRAKVTKGKKEIQQKKKGVKKLKPGTSRKQGRVKGRGKERKANQRARDQLAHSGSVKDASTAILGLLGDDD